MMVGPLAAALVMIADAVGAAHGQGGRSLGVAVDDAGVAHVGPASHTAAPSVDAAELTRPTASSEPASFAVSAAVSGPSRVIAFQNSARSLVR